MLSVRLPQTDTLPANWVSHEKYALSSSLQAVPVNAFTVLSSGPTRLDASTGLAGGEHPIIISDDARMHLAPLADKGIVVALHLRVVAGLCGSIVSFRKAQPILADD